MKPAPAHAGWPCGNLIRVQPDATWSPSAAVAAGAEVTVRPRASRARATREATRRDDRESMPGQRCAARRVTKLTSGRRRPRRSGRWEAGQETLAVDGDPGDLAGTHEAPLAVGGGDVEAQQPPVDVGEGCLHGHPATDRGREQVLQLHSGADARAAVVRPGDLAGDPLAPGQQARGGQHVEVAAAQGTRGVAVRDLERQASRGSWLWGHTLERRGQATRPRRRSSTVRSCGLLEAAIASSIVITPSRISVTRCWSKVCIP